MLNLLGEFETFVPRKLEALLLYYMVAKCDSKVFLLLSCQNIILHLKILVTVNKGLLNFRCEERLGQYKTV